MKGAMSQLVKGMLTGQNLYEQVPGNQTRWKSSKT